LENPIFLRNTGSVKRSEQLIENNVFINLQIGPFRVLDYISVAMATGSHICGIAVEKLWVFCVNR